MKIKNVIEEPDEDPIVDKRYTEITASLKEGGAVVLERFNLNPYEAVSVLTKYVIEKEQEEIEKLNGKYIKEN